MADTVFLAVYCTAASRRVSVHVFFSQQKNKKGGKKEEIELKYRSASAEALDKQPQSELLAGEMERQRNASVSRNFGQKMLFNALGARESSMVSCCRHPVRRQNSRM